MAAPLTRDVAEAWRKPAASPDVDTSEAGSAAESADSLQSVKSQLTVFSASVEYLQTVVRNIKQLPILSRKMDDAMGVPAFLRELSKDEDSFIDFSRFYLRFWNRQSESDSVAKRLLLTMILRRRRLSHLRRNLLSEEVAPPDPQLHIRSTRELIAMSIPRRARFPPAPLLDPSLADRAICPYCHRLTQVSDRAWGIHVIQDLQPGVCLYESCDKPWIAFSNIEDWLQHLAQHTALWHCHANSHQNLTFDSKAKFVEHLEMSHNGTFAASQLESICRLALRPSLQETLSIRPLLCLDCETPEDEPAGDDTWAVAWKWWHTFDHLVDPAMHCLVFDVTAPDQNETDSVLMSMGLPQSATSVDRMDESLSGSIEFETDGEPDATLHLIDLAEVLVSRLGHPQIATNDKVMSWLLSTPDEVLGIAKTPVEEELSNFETSC